MRLNLSPIILSTRWLPVGIDGITLGPVILIRRGCEGDAGLIAHERVHQRQQRRWLWLPWLVLYLASKRFRLAQEVEAYREQAKHYPDDRNHTLANHLATRYWLNITHEQALKALAG
jgi:hypothetical protein